jgi:hypothetical protein
VAAFRAGRPFYLRQDLQGIDSEVAEYYVFDGSGSMYRLLWDSDPSGGSGVGAHITQQQCASPTVVVRDDFEQVSCTLTGPMRDVCGR